MARLMIVMGSIRPGRVALPVALWALDRVEISGEWDSDFVDLLDFAPLVSDDVTPSGPDPRRAAEIWREHAAQADAVVWVSSDYRGGFSSALAAALDRLGAELVGVPCISVIYGRNADEGAGARALAGAARSLGMVVVADPVIVTSASDRISEVRFMSDEAEDSRLSQALAQLSSIANAGRPAKRG
ncbi:MAG: NADPH-dependent FMN reductase [Mycetocola sp.]